MQEDRMPCDVQYSTCDVPEEHAPNRTEHSNNHDEARDWRRVFRIFGCCDRFLCAPGCFRVMVLQEERDHVSIIKRCRG